MNLKKQDMIRLLLILFTTLPYWQDPNVNAVGKEFKDAANAVKTDAIETGKSVKGIVTE